jgi:2-dehydropantoate 2-reductase
MRIAVVGPGSLGSVYAALLFRGGHEVTLIARTERMKTLREQGVTIHGLEDLRVTVPVTDDPAQVGAVDLLLLCTKAIDTRTTLAGLRSMQVGAVASFQNGIVKEGLLIEAFGRDRVLGAATLVGAERQPDGTVDFTARGTTYIGEFNGHLSDRVGTAVAALDDAGLPAQALPDIESVIWSKACLSAAAFAVSAFSRLPMVKVFADPSLAGVMADLIAETASIAEAAGHRVHDYPGMLVGSWARDHRHVVVEAMAQRAAEMAVAPRVVRVSMLQDVLAGRPMEVDEVYGGILAEGHRTDTPTPKLAMARDLLMGIDRSNRGADSARRD